MGARRRGAQDQRARQILRRPVVARVVGLHQPLELDRPGARARDQERADPAQRLHRSRPRRARRACGAHVQRRVRRHSGHRLRDRLAAAFDLQLHVLSRRSRQWRRIPAGRPTRSVRRGAAPRDPRGRRDLALRRRGALGPHRTARALPHHRRRDPLDRARGPGRRIQRRRLRRGGDRCDSRLAPRARAAQRRDRLPRPLGQSRQFGQRLGRAALAQGRARLDPRPRTSSSTPTTARASIRTTPAVRRSPSIRRPATRPSASAYSPSRAAPSSAGGSSTAR